MDLSTDRSTDRSTVKKSSQGIPFLDEDDEITPEKTGSTGSKSQGGLIKPLRVTLVGLIICDSDPSTRGCRRGTKIDGFISPLVLNFSTNFG